MSDDKEEKKKLAQPFERYRRIRGGTCLIRFFCTSRARIFRHIVDGNNWRGNIGSDNAFHKIKMRWLY